MLVTPIRTRIMLPPKDDLSEVLDSSLPKLEEGDVVVVTSKIVSIGEGRCVPIGTPRQKRRLIEQEAEYLARFKESRRSVFSVKGHAVVGSAGIDESNANGYWILWPEDPFRSAREIWTYLRKRDELSRLGVIITDSTSPPMRLGCTGISIGFFGIHPLLRYIGTSDIFGREIARYDAALMGRKTFDAIPRPLTPRNRIVFTHFATFQHSQECWNVPSSILDSPFQGNDRGDKEKHDSRDPRSNSTCIDSKTGGRF